MDGVSAALTAVELVKLCYDSYHLLRTYIEEVREAQESLKDAVDQLQLNQRLFRFLSELLQEMEGSSYEKEVQWLSAPLKKQQKTLSDLKELLKRNASPKMELGMWKKIKWVHQKNDIEMMVGQLREQEVEVRKFIELVNTWVRCKP